jgi:hypothetical protein
MKKLKSYSHHYHSRSDYLSKKKLKNVYMQSQDEINEQVLNCMDDIIEVTHKYHIAISFTALTRVIIDEQSALKNAYLFKQELKSSKKHMKLIDNSMVF